MIEGEESKVIDDNNNDLEAKLASIDRFLAKEHEKFVEQYHGECLNHAFLLARRIIVLGEKPEIWEIEDTNFDAKTVDEKVIEPKTYQGSEMWGIHYVCVCGRTVYDPMIGRPVNVEDYMKKAFKNPVRSKVAYSYEDLINSTDINFLHHIRKRTTPKEKQIEPIEFKGSIVEPEIFSKKVFPEFDFYKYDWDSFQKPELRDYIISTLLNTELLTSYPEFNKNNSDYYKPEYLEEDQKKYIANLFALQYLDENYLDGEMSKDIQKLIEYTLKNDWSESKYGDPNSPIEKDFQCATKIWEELNKNNNLIKKAEYTEYN